MSALPLFCMRPDLGMRRWELVTSRDRSRSVFDRSEELRRRICNLDSRDKTSRRCIISGVILLCKAPIIAVSVLVLSSAICMGL